MKYLNLSLPRPSANLACDEALLDWCETLESAEILRFWEPAEPFVVVGYANRVATEVNMTFCREHGIPVLRRCSGGGTVLQASGCLNFSLILRIAESGPLRSITETNRFIMERHRQTLEQLTGRPVAVRGDIDLTLDGRKFSGNAQRRKRRCLLYHGTFLLDIDIPLVERALRMPSKEPDYRRNRSHGEFLTNINLPKDAVREALMQTWNARESLQDFPDGLIRQLDEEKYSRGDWNGKF